MVAITHFPFVMLGQTSNPAEVAREVSRTQNPSPSETGPAQNVLGIPVQELPERQEYGQVEVLYNTRPVPTFNMQVFSGIFYTTNAALVPNHEIDDWYFQQGLSFNWSKPLYQSSLIPHLSLYQAWFEYARTGDEGVENFSAMDVDLGLTYVLKKIWNIALSVDYVYERLGSLSLEDEIFHENHLILGVNKTFRISRTHVAFIQGFADYSLSTAPVVDERNEYGCTVGYAIDWTPEVSTILSYRYALYDYTQGPRVDDNNTFALSIIWRFRPSIVVQFGANYVLNDSNLKIFKYNVFNGGPTASVNFQW